jgi:hypothetical protein
MQLVPSRRLTGSMLVLGAAALGSSAVGVSAAAPRPVATAATPPKTVAAMRITRRSGTLAPGTKVGSADLGHRCFVDAKHGFALASVGQAQYPAATKNGGKTWKTDGPALHIDAAQAPLSVTDIGAATQKTVFAYGSGQVIDTTSDGGKNWYGALFDGLVMAVVSGPGGHLVAFVDGSSSGTGEGGVTWQYVSKNGGRSWRYDTAIGGS